MAVSTDDEKRKHPRVGFSTQIRILLDAGKKQIDLSGSSTDLSLKGIFVRTDIDALPAGTPCDIRVFLSGGIDDIVLSMAGTVARSSKTGMGIRFDSMDLDTYSHLKNIVYYNSMDDSV